MTWHAGTGGGLSNAGSAVGTALGIAAPCLAIFLWFAVTYTYRTEKRHLVATVVDNLRTADIATPDALPAKDIAKLTRQLEHADSATEFIIPALRDQGEGGIISTSASHRCCHSKCTARKKKAAMHAHSAV